MRLVLAITLFFISSTLVSQELNCVVNVNARQIEGSEKVMFEEMQRVLFQFVNSRKWTNHEYEIQERIECSILINLTERVSANEFKGNIQVQASRPIFNTGYKSPIMNIRDEDFKVRYNQFEPIIFNESTYSGELVSIIAFYVYMILGYDYDSFSLEGGTPFFNEALRIVNNAQGSSETGWRAFESRSNRYWLVENALNARFKPLRKTYYDYHRKGFDEMQQNMVKARNTITQSLKELRTVHSVEPSSYNMQVFFNAKSQEVINLYQNATPPEKNELSELLMTIDPGNSAKYDKLKK